MIVLDNESVDLPTPTGPMRSFIFRPSQPGRYPGLILYSEIFQVTGPIRRIAAMLAGHGMIVVVPEVYHEFLEPGTVLGYTADGAQKGNDLKVAKEVSAYDDDVKACIKYLKESPNCTGYIGAAGLCLGGCLAYRAALQPEIQATACWYATDIHKRSLGKGQNDDTLARTGDIKGSMLMIWGRQDPHVDGAGRAMIYSALTEAGKEFEWHEFNAAHAFMRDEGSNGRYNPELAALCIQLVNAFFKRHLGASLPPA